MNPFGQISESTVRRLACDALCQPLNYSALTWRAIHSTERHGLHKFIRLLTWSWIFLSVISVKESIPVCFFRHAKQTEKKFANISPLSLKSAWIVRVVSAKECNLFECSILLSSSIFLSLWMSQRSCNLTQTLLIRWLCTCTKPRCHNLTKVSQKRCIGGCINFNNFCLPLVVSGILYKCLETKLAI